MLGLTRQSCESPYAPALVRSTARARPSPSTGRCVQVKPLVSRDARAVAFALSGVQPAEWREQGHKTTSRDTQERSFARCRRIARNQNGFLAPSVGGEVWALTADPEPPPGPATHPDTAKTAAIALAALRRNRDASRASAARERSTVAPLTPPLRHRTLPPASARSWCSETSAKPRQHRSPAPPSSGQPRTQQHHGQERD